MVEFPRRLTVVLAACCLLCVSLVAAGGIFFAQASPAHAASAASWSEVWSDEFSGSANSAVDSQWQFDLGTGWGNNQVETDTNSTTNIYQDGSGHLVIKPVETNGSWTSGRIETTNDSFAAPAGGELEVTGSIQLPNVTGAVAQGYWPAFWMLGAGIRNGGSWPRIGEIDLMESINGTNVEYGTLHCGVDPGGPCNETSGLGGSTPCSGTTCQAGYHTYTMVVDRSNSPEQIRWYLDGTQFWQVSSNNPGMDATTWANAVDHGFFIILNVAMGGYWPGAPTSSTQSGHGMNIDYVRVYTASGSAGAPIIGGGSGSTPTPTPTNTPTPTPTNTPTPTPTSTSSNSVTNGGFELGSLSGWTCNSGDTVVTTPVHSGSYALEVAPSNSTTGECDQTISVQANHTYTLTAYVDGPYAYLGVTGSSSNWTSSTSYTKLTVTFTTTASQTSLTIYVHGWYAQGAVYVDDVSLS